ncbi:cytochrome b/b6 domain-containing protein [Paraburkholderia sp. GAS334]|uniref:cytochrome b/b6 domain-containing protein n=1 Tax=Paraburkholderia sp. GAS334 TaxID=3035131 RepID=UPI003D1ACD3C
MHRVAGYVAVGLVASRIVWGVIGTPNARFSTWWPGRAELVAYLRALPAGKPIHPVSHNPLGALMIVALWSLVLALGLTGWMMRLDAFWGEDWLESTHSALATALEVCVCVHVAAAVAMCLYLRENLIGAMVTGIKRPWRRDR